MKVHRLIGKSGIKSTVIVTMIGPGEAPQSRASVNSPTDEREFVSRIRRAVRKPSTWVGPLPELATATSYKELSAKYAADIARGRELQKQMFGGK